MAKSERFSVSLPDQFYRRVRRYARKDYGDNISFLIRVALSEFFERHYDEVVDPSLDRGGWRERDDEKPSEAMAVGAR